MRCISVLLAWLWMSSVGHAETIHMTDGRTVTARILKQDETSVTVDWFGVPVTYWRDEISRIDEGAGAGAGATPTLTRGGEGAGDAVGPATAALTPEQRALLDDVLEASGISEQLAQMTAGRDAHIEQEMQRYHGRLSDEQLTKLKQFFQAEYRPEVFSRVTRERFAKAFDAEKLSQIRDWYQTPLGRKLQQLEVETARPEAAQAAEQFAAELERTPPTKARLALVERLDRATHSSEGALQAVMGMTEGLFKVGAELDPQGAVQERTKWELERQRLLAEYRPVYKAAIQTGFLFIYREATDAELQEYLTFLESPTGQWVGRLMIAAIEEASRTMIEQMAGPLAKLAEEMKKAKASQPSASQPAAAPQSGGF